MLHSINSLLEGGVTSPMLFFILLLPLTITALAFARHIIGMRILSPYAIALIIYASLEIGILQTAAVTLSIFIVSVALRYSSKQLKMHYVPRMALLTTILASIAIVCISAFPGVITSTPNQTVAFVLLLTLSDTFLTNEIQKGYRETTKLFVQSFAVALIISGIGLISVVRTFIAQYPVPVLLFCLVANIYLGRWKGLRITEMYRFRSVIHQKAKEL